MRKKIIKGKVIKGEGWGTLIGFPTANLNKRDFAKNPVPDGVYACWVKINIGTKGYRNRKMKRYKRYRGIAVIGVKSFFQPNKAKLEIHLLNFQQDIVGRVLQIEIIKKLRPVAKFRHIEELVKQIKQDIKQAKKILN